MRETKCPLGGRRMCFDPNREAHSQLQPAPASLHRLEGILQVLSINSAKRRMRQPRAQATVREQLNNKKTSWCLRRLRLGECLSVLRVALTSIIQCHGLCRFQELEVVSLSNSARGSSRQCGTR